MSALCKFCCINKKANSNEKNKSEHFTKLCLRLWNQSLLRQVTRGFWLWFRSTRRLQSAIASMSVCCECENRYFVCGKKKGKCHRCLVRAGRARGEKCWDWCRTKHTEAASIRGVGVAVTSERCAASLPGPEWDGPRAFDFKPLMTKHIHACAAAAAADGSSAFYFCCSFFFVWALGQKLQPPPFSLAQPDKYLHSKNFRLNICLFLFDSRSLYNNNIQKRFDFRNILFYQND